MNPQLLELLGRFPQRPREQQCRVLSEADLPLYTRSLVSYPVQDDETITAYLLRPKSDRLRRDGRLPAVLAIHQHNDAYALGKAEAAGLPVHKSHAEYGRELAERGYVVLVPDQLGFEDRRPPEWQRLDSPFDDGPGYERQVYFSALLRGSTLQAKYLHDLTCAVDVLQSLDDVDPDRLGAVGHSLGGQETVWLMMYDERVRAGVVSCGVSTYATIVEDRVVHNLAFYVPNLLQLGDMDRFMIDIAPRGLFLSTGVEDWIFPIRGVRQIDAALTSAYAEQQASDDYRFVAFEGGHDFPASIRQEAYDWLDGRLAGEA